MWSIFHERDGKTIKLYYHKVLEAKIVLSDNIVISLGTEFIENEKENVSKQDCELNAAKRLLAKIKKDYPRLPICIQGDALYAAEPLMKLCKKKYIFRATGKFSNNNSNGRRCILHFQIHNSVSGITT